MNFLKRALLSVTRKKGKSLILLLVIFILGNVISGAISIQQATNSVESTIKERLGALAKIDYDNEKLWSMPDEELAEVEWTNLSIDLVHQVGEMAYVKYYDYNMRGYLESETLKRYEGDHEWEMHGSYMSHFDLKGVNYAPVIDFEEDKSKLVEGRVFTDEEIENGSLVGIISKKLADTNNLHLGDTFVLSSVIYDHSNWESDGEEIYASRDVAIEIIGLFETTSINTEEKESSYDNFDWRDLDAQNVIYVPNELVLSEEKFRMEQYLTLYKEQGEDTSWFNEDEEFTGHFTPIFVLNSPEDGEAFKKDVMPLLPAMYTVILSTDQYDSISGPVESMSKLSQYVLIVSVVATVLIIGLVVLLFLRDRKRELGIYLSLGESRSRVVWQIVMEVMTVSIIAISLSLFTGNLLAQGISGTMMKADEVRHDVWDDYYQYGDLYSDITSNDVIESFQVALDASYIMIFYVVGLLTILLSTVIPLTYIVRLNPKKIMM